MSELEHNNCERIMGFNLRGKVRKIPDKFLSEKLKKRGLTHYCFQCMVAIKPYEVEEKEG